MVQMQGRGGKTPVAQQESRQLHPIVPFTAIKIIILIAIFIAMVTVYFLF